MSQPALDPERLSFLGRRLAPGFVLRVVVVAPGGERAYDEREWRDAIVVVEWGEIVLEPRAGRPYRFGRGDVLWLQGLALRALRNPGGEPAVLVAVARRR
jgi:Cupin domain